MRKCQKVIVIIVAVSLLFGVTTFADKTKTAAGLRKLVQLVRQSFWRETEQRPRRRSYLEERRVAVKGATNKNRESDQSKLQEEEGDDPDLPDFLRGRHIDKDQYLNARGEQILRLRGFEPGKEYNPTQRLTALRSMERQIAQILAANSASPEAAMPAWVPVGPAPIPNGQTLGNSVPVSGRVISIAVHPTDPNKVYVGTANGGLYRSLDSGTTWTALMDTAQSLAIGAITIDPLTNTTVWVGTGEGNLSGDSFYGVGIYRIMNAESAAPELQGPFQTRVAGTETGASTGNAFLNTAITKIAFDPNNNNRMFIGNEIGFAGIGFVQNPGPNGFIGLYLSENAQGATPTFSRVAGVGSGNFAVKDIVFEPGSSSNMLLSVIDRNNGNSGIASGIYRTTNANTAAVAGNVAPTFSITSSLTARLNSSLAINKVGATVTVIAATATANGTVLKSTDGGATFTSTLTTANGFCGGQCSYDLTAALDPNDANKIYIGGQTSGTSTRIFARATDGSTFTESANGLHADAHAIAIAPSNPAVIYFGNDGGIFKSIDSGATWMSLNNSGFNATQFESLATHPTDREFMIGGTQDNGTNFKKPDGTWTRADNGDGGYAIIDQNATDTTSVRMYHTYFNSTTSKIVGYTTAANTSGAWNFRGCNGTAANDINCDDSKVLFYAPLVAGPGNPNSIYFGTDRLYRSSSNGTNHTIVSQSPIVSGVAISAIGIAANNDNVRAVGLTNGKVFRTIDGSFPLTDVTGTIPGGKYISRIIIDKTNNNIAYITLAGFTGIVGQAVWKSTNFLAASPIWAASGSGLPDIPANAFVIDPTDSAKLYVGTDIGIYNSTDSGTTWTAFSLGLPRVPVFDLAFQGAANATFSHVLRAATHGRGIWEIQPACQVISLTPVTLANVQAGTSYNQTLTASGGAAPYSFAVTSGNLPLGLALSNGGALTGTPTVAGLYNFTVTVNGSDGCPGSLAYSLIITKQPTIMAAASLAVQNGSSAGAAVTVATVNELGAAAETGSLMITVVAGGTATGINFGTITNTAGTITAIANASCDATSGTVRLQVIDNAGASATADLTVNVSANPAPTVGNYVNSTVLAGNNLIVTPAVAPTDNGSIVSVSASALPNTFTGSFNGNTATGALTINNAGPAGTYTITITVTDSCGATVQKSFTLLVNAPGAAYEADVAPRPNGNGNGAVTIADWVQAGRFAAALDTPVAGSEFQRADCAPRATLGDGKITLSDWVQAGRYAAGLDAVVAAGGPTGATAFASAQIAPQAEADLPRTVRTLNTAFQRGQIGSLQIALDAQGNENAASFSINFDPKVMRFLDATVGDGANGAALQINQSQTANGRIGLAVALPAGQQLAAGTRALLNLRFIPNGGDGDVITNVSFSDQLLPREVADVNADVLASVSYAGATITIAGKAVATVSAANYVGGEQAAESIVSAFGSQLAAFAQAAASLPLPISLGGSQVIVKDSKGVERFAPLFYASPTQINFQLPAGTAEGVATLTIFSGAGTTSTGLVTIGKVAPALFSADASGTGVATGSALLVRADGTRTENTLARYDAASGKFIAQPIDLGSSGDQVYLTLYGTGCKNRSDLTNVKVKIGGVDASVEYAGAQGFFAGLDQINVKLPRSLMGRGEVKIELLVDGKLANVVRVAIR